MIRRGSPIVAALAAALFLTSCSGSGGNEHRVSEGRDWHWDKDAGAAEAGAFMNVTVPEDATQTKGAVQVNPREDVYLLSFVTTEKNAEGIAADLHSKEPLKAKKKDFAPEGERFGHLGLPEPQTLTGTRWAGVCPPCVNDARRKRVQWIEIYVQPLKADRARVYLQAF
ncbi:hypothetical protein ACFOOM_05155 [Streptomyces echinoruber]|uniref:Lipoprotein n=1 Tax=Streptomyces echinoruber TaxID=68898 RepID=A0A918RBP0_9ACTN|nr:hypothetical protein [Streptomyces echinoruber]GGZ90686.1 hypothetical protein GCM10010389_31330 [Streptomyces echinoruber]